MYNSFGWNGPQQPILPPQPPTQQYQFPNNFAPRYEIVKVNGEAGAKNFRMAPNSSALLLDETAPMVWYAQTDGTGYLTVTPFDIQPHQAAAPVDINDLLTRVTNLEEEVKHVQQSYINVAKQPKKQRQQSNENATNDSIAATT